MNRTKPNPSRLYAAGTILLWSSAFVFTKIALEYFSPSSIGVLRYSCASLFFILLGLQQKIGLPKAKDLLFFVISGAAGFTLYMAFFNTASVSLTPATSSILIATAPIFTAIFSVLFFKEKIKPLGWVAIAIEFGGILVLTLWDGVFAINTGVLWMLAAALCISIYNLFQRHFSKQYSALQATAYSVFAGTVLMFTNLPHAVPELVAAPGRQWFAIIFMGIFPSAIAYFLWSKALSSAEKTSDVTNFMFVTPFLATLLGFLMIREVPTLSTIVGGVIILAGLFLFQKVKSADGKPLAADEKDLPVV